MTPSWLEGGFNEDEHSGVGSSLLPSGSHIYFSFAQSEGTLKITNANPNQQGSESLPV